MYLAEVKAKGQGLKSKVI